MLDDLGDVTPTMTMGMTRDMKKKSLSTKNLSLGMAMTTETSSGSRMVATTASDGTERITTV